MISEERQSHFAYLITNGLWEEDLVNYTDDERAMKASKKSVRQFVLNLVGIDEKVQQKIKSLKRNVFEGSSEWEVLYSNYFKEEMIRQGLD